MKKSRLRLKFITLSLVCISGLYAANAPTEDARRGRVLLAGKGKSTFANVAIELPPVKNPLFSHTVMPQNDEAPVPAHVEIAVHNADVQNDRTEVIKALLNAYTSIHLDAPFNNIEGLVALVFSGMLGYGGAEGLGPAVTVLINWAFPNWFYDNLSLDEQNNLDAFSLHISRPLQGLLGAYGLARGCDLANRLRYIRHGEFGDLFESAKKRIAIPGYAVAIVAAGALAANYVFVYYTTAETAALAVDGEWVPEKMADQFATLGAYLFIDALDQMAATVAGLARPTIISTSDKLKKVWARISGSPMLTKPSMREEVIKNLTKAAQHVNKLGNEETSVLYKEFAAAATPLEQQKLLVNAGDDEILVERPWYHHVPKVIPLGIAGLAVFTQYTFTRLLISKLQPLPGGMPDIYNDTMGNDTFYDGSFGDYNASSIAGTSSIYSNPILLNGIAAIAAPVKGMVTYGAVIAGGALLRNTFSQKTPSSTRRSLCYEVLNTTCSIGAASILAMGMGLNLYFSLDPHATPDQEYDSQRQWLITLAASYVLSDITGTAARIAQGSRYLPEVVANTTTRVSNAIPIRVKDAYTATKTTVASVIPSCVKNAYTATVTNCVAERVSNAFGWLTGKTRHLLTGRAPGEELSATEKRNKMIDRIEQGIHIAKASTEETTRIFSAAISGDIWECTPPGDNNPANDDDVVDASA